MGHSIGGKIGYILVIIGIAIWIASTAILFALSPNGLPEYMYYTIAAFDLIVGISTFWFVLKCRWFTSFFLSSLYCMRLLYLLLGWIKTTNIFNIRLSHRAHVNIISYFIAFSFIAYLVLTACWILDILGQIANYKRQHQTLVINGIHVHVDN